MRSADLIEQKIRKADFNQSYIFAGKDKKQINILIEKIIAKYEVPKSEVIRVSSQDKKNNISIEQIRALKGRLSRKAPSKRLVLIDEADHILSEAANSFLKVLEEPPANTIIILLCQTTELLPTIMSRCKLYLFPSNDYQLQYFDDKQLSDLKKLSRASLIFLAEEIDKKGQVKTAISDLLNYLFLQFKDNKLSASGIEKIVAQHQKLKYNINERLLFENLILEVKDIAWS